MKQRKSLSPLPDIKKKILTMGYGKKALIQSYNSERHHAFTKNLKTLGLCLVKIADN
jgi:hypothetical protein